MNKFGIYEILANEVEDDLGKKSNLQYQSSHPTKEEAWKEASRLNHLYQGHYNFTVRPINS